MRLRVLIYTNLVGNELVLGNLAKIDPWLVHAICSILRSVIASTDKQADMIHENCQSSPVCA